MSTHPIRGKTLLFRFDDGPMAGRSFTHRFHSDGSLDFTMGDGDAAETHVDRYEVAKLTDQVYAVSYLGTSGYTLTTVLDLADHHLVAFSSNDKELQQQRGTFTVAPPDRARSSQL